MSDEELWVDADRSGRIEVRQPCPQCGRGPQDKTLSLNTQKRVGYCHRCEWTTGSAAKEHFASRAVVDIEEERVRRQFKIDKILEATRPMEYGDLVHRYLEKRLAASLHTRPKLGYSHAVRRYTGRTYETTPAMVGAFQDKTGKTVGLHVTHLNRNASKAYGADSRRMHGLHPLKGSAIRLFPPGKTLIVAEGIETAVAVHLIEGDAVWACTSAALLRSVVIPHTVEHLIIAGDNDANGVGQQAAYDLHKRYRNFINCSVWVPDKENTDWLDNFRSNQ